MMKQGSFQLTGVRDNARNNAICIKARKTTYSLDGNIKKWKGFTIDKSIRMAEDKDKWRKYVRWCGQPSERGRLKNRTEQNIWDYRLTNV